MMEILLYQFMGKLFENGMLILGRIYNHILLRNSYSVIPYNFRFPIYKLYMQMLIIQLRYWT